MEHEEWLGHVNWCFVPGAKVQTYNWAFGNIKGTITGYDRRYGNIVMELENYPGISEVLISQPHWEDIKGRR